MLRTLKRDDIPKGWRPGFAQLMVDPNEPSDVDNSIEARLATQGFYKFNLLAFEFRPVANARLHEVWVIFVIPLPPEPESDPILMEFQWPSTQVPEYLADPQVRRAFFYHEVQMRIMRQLVGFARLRVVYEYQQDLLLAQGISRYVVNCRAGLVL